MYRSICCAIALAALCVAGSEDEARAEEFSDLRPGLSFNLVPYLWLPNIDTTIRYPLGGRGGTATTSVSAGPGDYIPKLNLGAMLAGEVRYDRFSLLTDIMYMNMSLASGTTRSFDVDLTGNPAERALTTSTSTRLEATIWTLAGGYTVAQGGWGNVDLIAGFRLLALSQTMNFSLAADITRPDGSVAVGHIGGLSTSGNVWNSIAGVRGRFYVGNADWFGGGRFFIPYYLDVGTGGSNLTWQAFTGLGYQAGRVSMSVGYRFLSFQQDSNAIIQRISLGGPIIAASIRF